MSSESKSKGVKPGYSNPAFKAMGIPTLRFPSRNWMIFWSVLTVSVSGILYDKYEQKQIKDHYQQLVKPLSETKLEINKRPRKITVFIAPPPSDYLDSSLKVWKRYVKPILYYAGLDYEVIEEEKQGVIRTEVANRIRDFRKQLQNQNTVASPNVVPEKDLPNIDEGSALDVEAAKKFKAEFDYRDLIGIFYKREKPTIIDEDSLTENPLLSGGVICLGRGAYKEYITGLHEGLLGPLDPPSVKPETKEENVKVEEHLETNSDENNKEKEKEVEKDTEVLKPFISPDEYSNVEIPQELQLSQKGDFLRDPITNTPILLHQSILMIPIPNLIGFLNIPERIYRFYRKRYYAEAVCSAVADMVEQNGIRPFESPQDLNLGEEEEEDWPKNWVKEGIKRNSEWTRELKDDPRIVEYIHLYNKGRKD